MSNYGDSHFTEYGMNTSWYKALNMVPKDSAVLDIGCSSGNFGAELITRKNCIVDGVELDKGDVALARKVLRNVYNLNIETEDLSDIKEKYDIIYLGDVVEHLFYPIATLEKCKQLLKKDGKIIFSIPNMAHISIRLLLLKGDFEYTETGLLDKTHVHFFNLKEINRVFNEAGYSLGELDYVEKDYPATLLKKWCKDAGVTVTKRFLDQAKQIDAAAFQFVGMAHQAKKKKYKLAQFGPVDFFEDFHNNTVNNYIQQVTDLTDRLSTLQTENSRLKSGLVRRGLRKAKRLIKPQK